MFRLFFVSLFPLLVVVLIFARQGSNHTHADTPLPRLSLIPDLSHSLPLYACFFVFFPLFFYCVYANAYFLVSISVTLFFCFSVFFIFVARAFYFLFLSMYSHPILVSLLSRFPVIIPALAYCLFRLRNDFSSNSVDLLWKPAEPFVVDSLFVDVFFVTIAQTTESGSLDDRCIPGCKHAWSSLAPLTCRWCRS